MILQLENRLKIPFRDLIKGLSENLKNVRIIKSELIKCQRYEQAAELRKIEDTLNENIANLNNIEESTTHNKGYSK